MSPKAARGFESHPLRQPLANRSLRSLASPFAGEGLSGEDALTLKSYDIGLAFGGAVQFGKFFVDGRYMFGLVNIDDDPDDEGFVEIKTRAFTCMLGFVF